jgi:hypothetical protein
MISKRLGILVIAMVALWSLMGLGWLGPAPGSVPFPVAVGTALAGPLDGPYSSPTLTPKGDPDQYVGSTEGDPDHYVGDNEGDDPEETDTDDPSSDSAGEAGHAESVVQLLASFFGFWF